MSGRVNARRGPAVTPVTMVTRSPVMPAKLATRMGASAREIARVLVVLLIALVPAVLPGLAYASPPDPAWISGFWNAADQDDVIALIWSSVKAVSQAAVTDSWSAPAPSGRVAQSVANALPAPLRSRFRPRAPPLVAPL